MTVRLNMSTFLRRITRLPAFFALAAAFSILPVQAQVPPTPGTPKPLNEDDATPKRIFGIIPNYRTSASLSAYVPIGVGDKFKIAAQDSFDRGTIALASAFAAESQLTSAEPSFGSGAGAYGRYFATSYADFVIGDMMTEAIFPSMLHQDPRYFRRGKGSGASRLGYAAGQIFWTHSDSGRSEFNISEIGGNATAVAISSAYYPSGRDVNSATVKLGTQLGVDMVSNILKEFSPDIYRKFSRKHSTAQ